MNKHSVRHSCVQFIASLNINSEQRAFACIQSFSMPDAFHVKIYLLFISLAIGSGQPCPPPFTFSLCLLQFYLLEPPQSSPLCAMRLFVWLMIICLSLNSINTLQITCIQTRRHTHTYTYTKYPVSILFCNFVALNAATRQPCYSMRSRPSVCILRVISFSSFLSNLNTT